jgi:CRISPR-associated protein Csb2
MSRFLCISVTLLDPLFHGRRDRNQAEWPPSPMRLFQALVNGACIGGRRLDGATREAFRWLERRAPPLIIAPRAAPATAHKLFVPNNDSDKLPDRQDRLTEKPVRPHRLADNGALHYVWELTDAEWVTHQAEAEAMCRVARRLLALGWGIDMAFADGRLLSAAEAAALPGVRWKPWPAFASPAPVRLRVPREGSLDDLDVAHRSFLESVDVAQNRYRPPRKPHVFDPIDYRPVGSLPQRPYVAFHLETTGTEGRDPAFSQARAAVVAARLRSRACEAAADDPHWQAEDAARYVAGHAGDAEESLARFSYLPLPSIGHPHADGMIRRVLIAEPCGASGAHARWACSRLNHTALIDEQTGGPCAVLAALIEPDGVLAAYLGPAEAWFTITPVILPGMDDHKHHKAERLIIKAVVQAGIDFAAVAEFALQKAPVWRGSLHPQQYHLPEHLRHLPRWHVRLRFRQPIGGPIAIGAGRHSGLGLFAGKDD